MIATLAWNEGRLTGVAMVRDAALMIATGPRRSTTVPTSRSRRAGGSVRVRGSRRHGSALRLSPPSCVSVPVPLLEVRDRGVIQGAPSLEVFIPMVRVGGEAPPRRSYRILRIPSNYVLMMLGYLSIRHALGYDPCPVSRGGVHRLIVHRSFRGGATRPRATYRLSTTNVWVAVLNGL
jgi:hypothetical protein